MIGVVYIDLTSCVTLLQCAYQFASARGAVAFNVQNKIMPNLGIKFRAITLPRESMLLLVLIHVRVAREGPFQRGALDHGRGGDDFDDGVPDCEAGAGPLRLARAARPQPDQASRHYACVGDALVGDASLGGSTNTCRIYAIRLLH